MSSQPESPVVEEGVAHDDASLQAMQAAFDKLKAAWVSKGGLSYKERMGYLKALGASMKARRDELIAALNQDFGNRCSTETTLAELSRVVESAAFARANLLDWMEPQEREVGWQLRPATGQVRYQPLGVVGIIAPWNYPIQLSIDPLVAAIAAGNRVIIKPSELTPNTTAALRSLLSGIIPEDVVQIVEGDSRVGSAFASLPLDHLLFTGSTKVGKLVMKAAAENLTPVTLELGGKSPTIVHPSFNTAQAAERIVWAKCFNSGQTCIAPDYVMVHKSEVDSFVSAAQAAFAKFYPRVGDNTDYTAIISEQHHRRLCGLISESEQRGTKVVRCNPANEDDAALGKKLPLTLVVDPPKDSAVMTEEIFGTVLPIVPFDEIDECIRFVNDRPRPLALYYFDHKGKRVEDMLERTVSGGAGVNEALIHVTQETMPFGGVGASGMGSYHGYAGFRTFSHEKSVMQQSRMNGMNMLNPPYGSFSKLFSKLLGL